MYVTRGTQQFIYSEKLLRHMYYLLVPTIASLCLGDTSGRRPGRMKLIYYHLSC